MRSAGDSEAMSGGERVGTEKGRTEEGCGGEGVGERIKWKAKGREQKRGGERESCSGSGLDQIRTPPRGLIALPHALLGSPGPTTAKPETQVRSYKTLNNITLANHSQIGLFNVCCIRQTFRTQSIPRRKKESAKLLSISHHKHASCPRKKHRWLHGTSHGNVS